MNLTENLLRNLLPNVFYNRLCPPRPVLAEDLQGLWVISSTVRSALSMHGGSSRSVDVPRGVHSAEGDAEKRGVRKRWRVSQVQRGHDCFAAAVRFVGRGLRAVDAEEGARGCVERRIAGRCWLLYLRALRSLGGRFGVN